MSRFISFVLFLIVVLVGIGFFRGWFSMNTIQQPTGEKLDIHFQVDRDKMKQDATTVEQKTKSLLGSDNDDSQPPR